MRRISIVQCALILILICVAGCPAKTLEVRLIPPASTFDVVAVMPVEIAYAAAPGESKRRTHDVLSALWRQTTWRVLSPQQFRILDAQSPDLLTASDLILRGRDLGFDARRAIVLKTRVAMAEATGRAETSDGGVGHDYQGRIDVHVTLLGMASQVLGEVHVIEQNDPFAERPEYDELPTVSAALERALNALLEACPSCIATIPRPDIDVFPNPASVLLERDDAGRSLRQILDATSGPERDVMLWQAMQYFRHDITLSQAKRLADVPPGACFGAKPVKGLEPGDCVIAAEGIGIDGPHALGWILSRGEQVALTIVDNVGTSRIVLVDP